MSQRDIVQSHLEVLIAEYLGSEGVVVDDDGDIAVRDGRAGLTASVRVIKGTAPHLRVVAPVVLDVDADPGLFEALNSHNAALSHARIWWADRVVVIGGELNGPSAELADLGCLCAEISGFVGRHAAELAERYRGRVLFEDDGEGR